MLVLSRKVNESIVIDGAVTVKVLRIEGDVIKLGIQAPPHIPVHRQEIYDEIQRTNREALASSQRNAGTIKSGILARKPQKTAVSAAPEGPQSPKPEQIHA